MRVLGNVGGRFGAAGVALFIVALTILGAFAAQPAPRPGEESPAWAADIQRFESALTRRDVGAAVKALHAVYLGALASGRWQGMIAHGDAAVRIAEVSGARRPWIEKARQSYLMGLFRARDAGDLEGVFRAAEGFHRLGDREVADLALRTAERMAGAGGGSRRVRERVAWSDDVE